MITVEVIGLELHGFHGVHEDERRDGQRFLFDVWLDVPDAAAASDRIEDAVDYREVVACVREVSDGRKFQPARGALGRGRGRGARAVPGRARAGARAQARRAARRPGGARGRYGRARAVLIVIV